MTKILNTADKSSIKLIRMNGAGNTFVIHDSKDNNIKINKNFINYLLDSKKIKKFDQFVEIDKSENSDAKVTFWNIDGSEAEMCGNALRCISSLILNKKDIKECHIETVKRNVKCWKNNEKIFVDIGKPILSWNEIPLKENIAMESTLEIDLLSPPCDLPKFSAVNVGNPHAVFFFDDKTPNLLDVGKSIEENEMFPMKVNVSFAEVIDNKNIRLNVWERGAGITQACGSAACATAVASASLGYTKREVNIILPGGNIEINWQNDDHIVMTGPYEFDGEDIVNISDYK
ncbi:MAG: diaminopimelate epimerase [Alphaproteobacteria bacterium]|tara:strand:+ start:232 stop:1095 length:864 start_codon:yes stop_codon:yes gene_type:complete